MKVHLVCACVVIGLGPALTGCGSGNSSTTQQPQTALSPHTPSPSTPTDIAKAMSAATGLHFHQTNVYKDSLAVAEFLDTSGCNSQLFVYRSSGTEQADISTAGASSEYANAIVAGDAWVLYTYDKQAEAGAIDYGGRLIRPMGICLAQPDG